MKNFKKFTPESDAVCYEFDKIFIQKYNARVHDFGTLYRKLYIAIISFHGFVSRQFLTTDGFFLANSLYCPDINLKKIAASMRMPKQLHFGMTD